MVNKYQLDDSLLGPMPQHVRPMWVAEESKPFSRPGWVFEVKYDGYRAVAEIGPSGALLYSRNEFAMSNRYPRLTSALARLGPMAVLDGEIVVIGRDRKPDFQALRSYSPRGDADIRYFAFDILWLEGYDLTTLPLLRRKVLLEAIVPSDGVSEIQYVDHIEDEGEAFFQAIRAQGLEGMVAKQAASPYRPDDRTPRTRRNEWVKVKHYIRQSWEGEPVAR